MPLWFSFRGAVSRGLDVVESQASIVFIGMVRKPGTDDAWGPTGITGFGGGGL